MGLHATWQHGYTVLTDGPAEGVTSSGLTLDDPKEPFAWAPGASSGSSPLSSVWNN
jgi:hypothetical protein